MKVGIVSTWFERGAAYVSKQFYSTLVGSGCDVAIYARGGEKFAKGDPKWDFQGVYWQGATSFVTSFIHKNEFEKWLDREEIELLIFNEQHYWQPILWAKAKGIKTVAYIDYYTQETVELYELYDAVICNTKRHFSVFSEHKAPIFLPWGTDINLYNPSKSKRDGKLVFFHSCGMSPHRKGTDFLIKAAVKIKELPFKLIIHSQADLVEHLPFLRQEINDLTCSGVLETIEKTVTAPGLYTKGDVYVYPSRLEGIGLTVAEALASGLPCIVPDNEPMNEFLSPFCLVSKIDNFIARADGYYWPECHTNIDSLAKNMQGFISKSREEVNRIKSQVREHSCTNLDWSSNSNKLLSLLEKVQLSSVDSRLIHKAAEIDNKGRPHFIKFSNLYNFFYRLAKRK